MADEVELARLVTRFLIDNQGLIDGFGEVRKATEGYGVSVQRVNQLEAATMSARTKVALQMTELNKLVKDGKLSQEAYNKELERLQSLASPAGGGMGRGVQEWTAYAQQGLRATTEAASLLRGEFETVGEAANKVANVAQLIPGPWGAAISTVISVIGQLVDFINRDLIKAQQAAKQEFMAIAKASETVEQGFRRMDIKTMTEGLGRMVQDMQTMQQMGQAARGGFFNPVNVAAGLAGADTSQAGLRQAAQDRNRQWMANQLEMRRQSLEALLTDPGLQELRSKLALAEIGAGLLDKPLQMEEHAARRKMMMAMHRGGTGSEAQRQLAVQQLQNANAELAVRQLIRATQDANGQATMTQLEAEARLRPQIERSNRALVEDMRRRQAERLDEHFVQQTERARQELQGLIDANLRLRLGQGQANEFELKQLEERQKIERELAKLQEEGASFDQLVSRRRQLEQAAGMRLYNQELTAANRIFQSTRTSVEKYADEMERLNYLKNAGRLNEETYSRAVIQAQQHINSTIQTYDAASRAGLSLVEGYRDPMAKLEDKLYDLAAARRAGIISEDEYRNAIMRVRDEQDKLNSSISKTQAVAWGSAEAVGRIGDYMRRIAGPIDTSNPFENQVGPGRSRVRAGLIPGTEGGPAGTDIAQLLAQLRGEGIAANASSLVTQAMETVLSVLPGRNLLTPLEAGGGWQPVRAAIDASNEILRQILEEVSGMSDSDRALADYIQSIGLDPADFGG